MEYISNQENPILSFLDGDYSDYPDELTTYPYIRKNIDFVVGSRWPD
jgi:hypothetical protein